MLLTSIQGSRKALTGVCHAGAQALRPNAEDSLAYQYRSSEITCKRRRIWEFTGGEREETIGMLRSE